MKDRNVRLYSTLGLLALVAIAGMYLSGYLTLLLLKLNTPLEWNTWWKYYKALDLPRFQPFATRIKLAGILGFGSMLLLWLVAVAFLFKRKERTLYGDSRFATGSDLRKHKVLDNTADGIIAGSRFGGEFVKVTGKHMLLASPTRSGKGVSTVIPNCLEWAHSIVVLDVKQEAYEKTAGYRQTLGEVFLFDPFTQNQRSHRWNPLGYVSFDPLQRSTDIEAIASSLFKEGPGQDPFWVHSSRGAFQAICEYLFDEYLYWEHAGLPKSVLSLPTLAQVYQKLSAVGQGDEKKVDVYKKMMGEAFVGEKARLGLGNLVSLPDETFGSVIATTQAPLRVFGNPVVAAATSGNDFDLKDLRRTVQSIYVGVPPSKLVEAKGILNLFFEQAIKLNGSTLPEHDKTLKYQCMFLLDEFTALGEVAIIPVATGWLAGYGVRIVVVIQSVAQLEAVYGVETARGMITNLGCQVIFAPREQRDANEYSEMLGYTTVKKRNVSRSHGQSSSVSYSEVEERRALMLPQELKALSPEEEIIFVEGAAHPIKCGKIRYYQDDFFKKRLLERADVQQLKL